MKEFFNCIFPIRTTIHNKLKHFLHQTLNNIRIDAVTPDPQDVIKCLVKSIPSSSILLISKLFDFKV